MDPEDESYTTLSRSNNAWLIDNLSGNFSSFERHLILRIIASAVLVFAVFLLLFNLVRLLYNSLRSNRAAPDQLSEAEKSTPDDLDDEQLSSLPVFKYEELPTEYWKLQLESEGCTICLEEYVNGDTVRVFPRCKHIFHKECVDEWLKTPSLICPICRDRVMERFVKPVPWNCRSNSSLAPTYLGTTLPISRIVPSHL